jgi:hypothetical protein
VTSTQGARISAHTRIQIMPLTSTNEEATTPPPTASRPGRFGTSLPRLLLAIGILLLFSAVAGLTCSVLL